MTSLAPASGYAPVNASSRDDFETKSFQSYHVIKSNQRIPTKIKTNFRMRIMIVC